MNDVTGNISDETR